MNLRSLPSLLLTLVTLVALAGCTSTTASTSDTPTVTSATTASATSASVATTTAVPLATASSESLIHICDDGSEWPPYTYYQRVNGEKSDEITGYAVDVVQEIFSQHNISFTVELLPWKRCLDEVESGQNYQMLLNASYSEERAEKYTMSEQFYVTNSYYFYSKQQHPDGLAISDKADLKNFQVCGILGYNYTEYDVPDVDTGTTDYVALISKLHAGRCDLFLEKYEIMSGFSVMGTDFLADEDLGYAPVEGTEPAPFYMMFPKNAQGEELKTIIDAGLKELGDSGRLAELLKKYVP